MCISPLSLSLSLPPKVAQNTDADIVTDLSDNFDVKEDGTRVISHRSLAIGDAFAHNFFTNNYGKANFCVRPLAARSVGGHDAGERGVSPFVDWSFFTRASLKHLKIELVPLVLYHYTKV